MSPAPKGNKNGQKGLRPKVTRIQFRATRELKDALDSHAAAIGEPVTDILERLIVSYLKNK